MKARVEVQILKTKNQKRNWRSSICADTALGFKFQNIGNFKYTETVFRLLGTEYRNLLHITRPLDAEFFQECHNSEVMTFDWTIIVVFLLSFQYENHQITHIGS